MRTDHKTEIDSWLAMTPAAKVEPLHMLTDRAAVAGVAALPQ